MVTKKIALLLIVFILLASVFVVMNAFEKEVPAAENGTLLITRDDMDRNRGVIALNGDFMAVDGIVSPGDFGDAGANVKYMTLDDIRLYNYPKGTLTAKMTVETGDVPLTGIIIDEIHTAYRLYVNGELISSAGKIGADLKSTVGEKKSAFLPLENAGGAVDIVIQIANFETLSGQLRQNIYVGSFDGLQSFYNLKLNIKLLCIGFMTAVFFILLGLYIKNKKHSYLLSLSLASLLNLYYLIDHFAPFVLFNPTGGIYTVNSCLSTFPALFVVFLSAVTVILFYRIEPLYTYMRKFIKINSAVFLITILILIYFDKTAYPLYFVMIIYTYALMGYAGVMSGVRFVRGKNSAVFVFTGIFACLFYFGLLFYITFDNDPCQTLSSFNIFLILPLMFFYIILCLLAITHFSKQFSITELSETELERLVEEKNAQLRQSLEELKQKDRQRAEMLMNISHDLRSPMTVVKGYADLLNKGRIDQSEYHKYMEIIYNKVSYVVDLINDLLDLANLETNINITMDAEYIDAIIGRVVAQYKGGNYTICADIPKDTMILCNGKNIFRLFCNLIDNAIEYSDENAYIRLSGKVTDNTIIIKIKDNGRGIATRNLSYIFERFTTRNTQTNENGNHFGLGLAICKAIVQNHNGTISCESVFGEGTTFTVTFPLYKGDDEDHEAADH